jgi:hypothetical protein
VGTAGDGLHTMDRNKGTFERHSYDPAHPEKLSRPRKRKLMKALMNGQMITLLSLQKM